MFLGINAPNNPNWPDLLAMIDLETVAWGNARIDANNQIECQHGSNECYGNVAHNCGSHHIGLDNAANGINWSSCLTRRSMFQQISGESQWLSWSEECYKSVYGLPNLASDRLWGSVSDCINGSEGDKLTRAAGDKAAAAKCSGVPCLFLDDQPLSDDQENSIFTNLFDFACKNTPVAGRPASCAMNNAMV
jgi:interferon gamma-inducible protein 30